MYHPHADEMVQMARADGFIVGIRGTGDASVDGIVFDQRAFDKKKKRELHAEVSTSSNQLWAWKRRCSGIGPCRAQGRSSGIRMALDETNTPQYTVTP